MKQWFRLLQADGNALAFSLAAIGIVADALDRLFSHGVKNAIPKRLDLARKHVTPHVIRHTTAMRLLQAEVDIAVFALWPGHESSSRGNGDLGSADTTD